MKVCVAGLWHLGSVTAACLAKKGFDVLVWDPDASVLERWSRGKAPLFEPGLDELMAAGITSGRLRTCASAADAVRDADFLWVTFDTPVDDEDRADVEKVKHQIRHLAAHLKSSAAVVISSQLPVGTCAELEGKNPIAYSPENLRLGKAISIFLDPDRIVVGIRKPEDRAFFEPLFQAITSRIEWMKTESAEMTKHAINAFLATSVTFINELARLCEATGADAREVERGLKSEARIGPKAYLKPGAAFAGGTLARDVRFLTDLGRKRKQPTVLLNAILESNEKHKDWAREKLNHSLKPLKGRQVAILGLTYKEGTDTLRRSWTIELAQWLHAEGARVRAYDWQLQKLPKELGAVLSLEPDGPSALKGSDALVVGTDHPGLKQIQVEDVRLLKQSLIIDPNGALQATSVPSEGPITYCSVGFSFERKAK